MSKLANDFLWSFLFFEPWNGEGNVHQKWTRRTKLGIHSLTQWIPNFCLPKSSNCDFPETKKCFWAYGLTKFRFHYQRQRRAFQRGCLHLRRLPPVHHGRGGEVSIYSYTSRNNYLSSLDCGNGDRVQYHYDLIFSPWSMANMSLSRRFSTKSSKALLRFTVTGLRITTHIMCECGTQE